jgi:2-polyprenyl-3-methyl-5-hydroxy-6-metoxy-1,4-benzoquinol methylase
MPEVADVEGVLDAADELLRAGRSEAVLALCKLLLDVLPDQPRALLISSVAHLMKQDCAAAEAVLLRGCAAHPHEIAFHSALARLRLQMQRFGEALAPLERCVLLSPDNRDHRVALISVYQARLFNGFSELSKQALLTCLLDDTLSHGLLHRQWFSLLGFDPESAELLSLFAAPDYATFGARISLGLLESWQNNRFLSAGLARFLVADLGFERGLTFTRRWLCENQAVAQRVLPLLCRLACYCFFSEYVFSGADEQAGLVHSPETAAQAALLGCYQPLFQHEEWRRIAALSSEPSFRELVQTQIVEPLEEQSILQEMAPLVVSDPVSLAVQRQYEENPYPRWSTVGTARQLPPEVRALARDRSILFAGCGTGREAAEAALIFPEARVTGIDLSRPSLAFAMRKAKALGLTNLRFEQADLLTLDRSPQRFDFIVCAGVLHHLEHPGRGLLALLEALKPRGVLRIALYSTIARRAISDARAWVKQQGFLATPAGIRDFRAAVARLDAAQPMRLRLATSYDFYSLSQCRDLAFHVQERTFTCLEVAELLAASGLSLLRLDTKSPAHLRAYQQRFPRDPEARNLGHWHALETEHPTMFAGMYSLWLCRSTDYASVDMAWISETQRFG